MWRLEVTREFIIHSDECFVIAYHYNYLELRDPFSTIIELYWKLSEIWEARKRSLVKGIERSKICKNGSDIWDVIRGVIKIVIKQ